MITVPFKETDAKTEDLIKGLIVGFNFAMYEIEAVNELDKRGYHKELIVIYNNPQSRKLAKVAIKRLIQFNVISLQ